MTLLPVALLLLSQGAPLEWESPARPPMELSLRAWDVRANRRVRSRYRITLPLSDALDQDLTPSPGVSLLSQPRKANQHTAVLRTSTNRFELAYQLYPHSWFDAPAGWWDVRDVVDWTGRGAGRILVTCERNHCESAGDRFTFTLPLPSIPGRVALSDVAGATVEIREHPTRQNGYRTRVAAQLKDPGEYAFRLTWFTPPR